MSNRDSQEISGVSDQELAAVTSVLPALPYLRSTPVERFAQTVRALVEDRAQDGWRDESDEDIAVFVYVKYPRDVGEAHGGTPFADPMAQRTPLLGHLFFSNSDASQGQFINMPTCANEILEWLAENNLGDRPIVTVYRAKKRLISRPEGLESHSQIDRIRDAKPTATLEELNDALKHFHLDNLLTPTRCPQGVWESNLSSKYVPGPEPEKSIQSILVRVLSSWFHGVVRAEREDSTGIGRIDVRLLKQDQQSGLVYWATLELKVIKSYRNAQTASHASRVRQRENVDTIVEGIKQAWAYKNNREAEIGTLEVYDMRENKNDTLLSDPDVIDTLSCYSPPPELHFWPLYGQAADARNAKYSGV